MQNFVVDGYRAESTTRLYAVGSMGVACSDREIIFVYAYEREHSAAVLGMRRVSPHPITREDIASGARVLSGIYFLSPKLALIFLLVEVPALESKPWRHALYIGV